MPPAAPSPMGVGLVARETVEEAGEGRRKKESIDSLVQELVQSPADHVPSVLRTALERGWREDLQEALQDFERKKNAEISRVCNRHYAEFIDCVEELMKMRGDLVALRDRIVDLNSNVQETGRSALASSKMLLQQKHAAANIASATEITSRCAEVVNMVMDAFLHIHEEKYYSALNTMDEIQRRLDAMGGVKFAGQLRQWMPSLTEMINKATKEEMSQWLVDIRGVSYKVGAAAMRRYARLTAWEGSGAHRRPTTGASGSVGGGTGSGGESAEALLHVTSSLRFLLRLEDELGCGLGLDIAELGEFVPHLMARSAAAAAAVGAAAPVIGGGGGSGGSNGGGSGSSGGGMTAEDDAAAVADEERALERLSTYLHPVHRALHIFARLHMLPDLRAWYLEHRRPMAELRAMITRDLEHLPTDGFLMYLPTLASGVSGFFIVETTLLQKVEHPEGLMTGPEVERAWMQSQESLRDQIESHTRSLARPGHFVQVKDTLLALAHVAVDLKMDAHVMHDMMRRLVAPFQNLVLLAFEGQCRRALQEETYQPLEVLSRQEYDSTIVPLGLDAAWGDGDDDVLSGGARYGTHSGRFRRQHAFSATVPEIGFAMLKVAGLVVSFLSSLDVPNAAGQTMAALEKAAGVVRSLVLEQLRETEADGHILKASQISVNSAYLSKLPEHIGAAIWKALAAFGFADAALQGLRAAGRSLEAASDQARDLIFELVRRKADELLAGLEFVKWEPTATRRAPHQYADDLVQYLRVTFMNLGALPSSMREAVHFTSMTHVCEAMLSYL
ncbi:unnamed protein product, partial [Phaeothamnion confervicola]